MRIEYYHASVFGNGAAVAQEFKRRMDAGGVAVNVRHIREASPHELPPAELYLFSAPGRMGKPIGRMRRFLKKMSAPAGARYAILTTEAAPRPGPVPAHEEPDRWQRVIPTMNELLQNKGLVKVAEGKVLVTGLKGPLEEGWQEKVGDLASRITEAMANA